MKKVQSAYNRRISEKLFWVTVENDIYYLNDYRLLPVNFN